MTDTLYTISVIANDTLFRERLHAAAAQQDVPGDPVAWVWNNRYDIASAPSWAEKVDYWLALNPPENPEDINNGWALDVAVISDADIISQIQAMLAEEQGPPGQQ